MSNSSKYLILYTKKDKKTDECILIQKVKSN